MRKIVVSECGIIPGWERPAMPVSDTKKDKASTVQALNDEGDTRRNAVAQVPRRVWANSKSVVGVGVLYVGWRR